ncbi:TPA: hypothetical protein QB352_001471 [Pasteurella multocida]|nr:hypothetical protein [Pasteurella multocida]
MPNWCENSLEVSAQDSAMLKSIVEKVLRFDQEENQHVVDFNLLIPMPEEVNIISGGYGWPSFRLLGLDRLQQLTDELIDEFIKDGKKALRLSLLSRERHWTVGDFIHWLNGHSLLSTKSVRIKVICVNGKSISFSSLS